MGEQSLMECLKFTIDPVQIETMAKVMALKRLHRRQPNLSWDELCRNVNQLYNDKCVTFACDSPPPAPTEREGPWATESDSEEADESEEEDYHERDLENVRKIEYYRGVRAVVWTFACYAGIVTGAFIVSLFR